MGDLEDLGTQVVSPMLVSSAPLLPPNMTAYEVEVSRECSVFFDGKVPTVVQHLPWPLPSPMPCELGVGCCVQLLTSPTAQTLFAPFGLNKTQLQDLAQGIAA